MTRLQAEWQRLYLHEAGDGRVRALVLEVKQPAGWDALSRVWQGVQHDLDWPAPAIAISGSDAYQLWFSLAQPVDAQRATAVLQHLVGRYLRDVPLERVRVQAVDPGAPGTLPPAQVAAERWSAFVSADLAALFAEERWLDHPPGSDAQADLLSRVQAVKPEVFLSAEQQLAREQAAEAGMQPEGGLAAYAPTSDPRRFLLSVMQDASAPLHLRIEAAKALLSTTEGERSR